MNHSKFIVSNQKEESISTKRVIIINWLQTWVSIFRATQDAPYSALVGVVADGRQPDRVNYFFYTILILMRI